MTDLPVERFEVSLNTPAGQLTMPVEVPISFVPVTAIVPLMRRLSEQAQALEERKSIAAGHPISCRMGCAACCRMLVPVSAPEAFALKDMIQTLPDAHRARSMNNLSEARARLEQAGLLERLTDVAETTQPLTDEEMEPLNREYYVLRMPCPFLENETCSIYEDRPAACRELLVTTPAELCQDMVKNEVQALPVPVRISTVLGALWSELVSGPARLIPLPIALDWAERHSAERSLVWKGTELLEKALDKVWRYLNQELAHRAEVGSRMQRDKEGTSSGH
jgi:Fe-S-cluster containining protein